RHAFEETVANRSPASPGRNVSGQGTDATIAAGDRREFRGEGPYDDPAWLPSDCQAEGRHPGVESRRECAVAGPAWVKSYNSVRTILQKLDNCKITIGFEKYAQTLNNLNGINPYA